MITFIRKYIICVQASTEPKEWPNWAIILIFVLIIMAVIWIPLVALLRVCGIHLLNDEEPSWFPADELREFHGIIPHKVTSLERIVFNMKDNYPPDDV